MSGRMQLAGGGGVQQLGDAADAVRGQFDGQLDDALMDAHIMHDAQAFDQVQHRRVVGKQQRGEARNALVARAVRQGLGEPRANAVLLPIVSHGDGEFGDVGTDRRAYVACDADSLADGGVDGHESFVVVVVDLGEVGELGRRQRAVR
jgi:hypothetical protein